jgi:hypothetical protein
VDKLSPAFIAWLVAREAWLDADRRLADASPYLDGLTSCPKLAEEVAALKAKADALAAVVKEELHMETSAPTD